MTCVNVLLFSLSTDSFALTHIFAGFCARFHSHRMSNEINGKSFVSFAFFSASFFFSDVNGTTNKFTFYVSNEEGRRKERSISNEQGRETGREREGREAFVLFVGFSTTSSFFLLSILHDLMENCEFGID